MEIRKETIKEVERLRLLRDKNLSLKLKQIIKLRARLKQIELEVNKHLEDCKNKLEDLI